MNAILEKPQSELLSSYWLVQISLQVIIQQWANIQHFSKQGTSHGQEALGNIASGYSHFIKSHNNLTTSARFLVYQRQYHNY
jgi:hypothetical protein